MSVFEDVVFEVGQTWQSGPKSKPRKIVRKGYWWNRNYHGLITYLGRDGKEVEVDEKVFRKWAVKEIK